MSKECRSQLRLYLLRNVDFINVSGYGLLARLLLLLLFLLRNYCAFLSQESAKGKLAKRVNPAAAQMGAKAGEKAVEMGAKAAEKQMEMYEKQRGKVEQFLGEEVRQNGNSDFNRRNMKAIGM